jgi:NitT/TauT family transport system substrate-binding protein
MMSKTGRLRLLAAVASIAFLGLSQPASADDPLTIVSAFPGGIEVIENVALNAGLEKAEHLQITKQYSGSASACAQIVAAGKDDVCAMSIEPIIQGYSKGLHLQIFFARTRTYDYQLAVLDDSPIRTLADFKDKQIGEPNVASTVEISTNDMLEGAGLRKSDYSFVPVGVGGSALSALTSHKIDAISTSAVELATLTAVGHVKFRVFRDPILDSLPNVGFAARPDVIGAKADVLQRFARAIVKAALLIRENPHVAARYALQGENVTTTITPEAIDAESRQLIALQNELVGGDPASTRIGTMPVNGVQLYCQFMENAGLTPALVPAAAVITNQFIPYANGFDKKAWIAEVRAMR